LNVDRRRVAISYSGGGAMVLVELGIAQAFVELGIRPHAIAGVSAGGMAAAAHAIDPVGGAGIRAAAEQLAHVSNRSLGLGFLQVAFRALMQRSRLSSLGDNSSVEPLMEAAFRQVMGQDRVTFGYFGREGRPRLFVGATDRLTGEAVFFPPDADVAEALVGSAAIPALFAPRPMTVGGVPRLLIDGAVMNNQPLSVLALDGCGTIYSCAVGYDGGRLATPSNLIDNSLMAVAIGLHAGSRLEQAYVQQLMGDTGVIHHVHPEVPFPVQGFDFTPAAIEQVMREAREATRDWIEENGLMPPGQPLDLEPAG
jgi:NTE family protein